MKLSIIGLTLLHFPTLLKRDFHWTKVLQVKRLIIVLPFMQMSVLHIIIIFIYETYENI